MDGFSMHKLPKTASVLSLRYAFDIALNNSFLKFSVLWPR